MWPRRLLLRMGLQSGLLAALPVARAASAAGPLSFPRDFGAHPQTQLEWWYLTGVLSGAAQATPEFGYQLTFFRIKGPAPASHPSRFAARQLLMAHMALSDLRSGKTHQAQALARTGLGLAEASEQDCAVHLRGSSLQRLAPTGYRARLTSAKGFAIELNLHTTQPLLLQGEQGLSRKGPQPAQFSHYYSQVQLLTEASLQFQGRRLQLQGRSWLDHEWSDNLLGEPGADQAVGWDWAGINLLDGSALTLFRLRRADGSLLWHGGSWRSAGGQTHNFSTQEVQVQAGRRWPSPDGAAHYPVEWLLHTPQGRFKLSALSDAQEIDARLSTGMRYWEGAAELRSEDGRQCLGFGYLEMTGYAGAMRLG